MQTIKRIFSAVTRIADNNGTETGLAESLDSAVLELVRIGHIRPDVLAKFSSIRDQVISWVTGESTADTEQKKSTTWSGWGWQPYVNHLGFRIGLLRIYKNNPVPAHDHPGASGILLVLDGEIDIDEYQPEQVDSAAHAKLAKLLRSGRQRLANYQYAFITPDKGNIHSLSAKSDVCVLLDILLVPYDEKERTWYMPFSEDASDSNTVTAFCVTSRVRTGMKSLSK